MEEDEIRKVPIKDCGESYATERAIKAKWERYRKQNPGLPSPSNKVLDKWSRSKDYLN